MVLVLNGVLQEDCPPDSRALYLNHPVYRETAAQLLSVPNKIIGPVGLLYVLQRELAATVPHDKNVSILGSDDVTTCLIVVVRHSGSGAVAMAHLDGSGTDEAVCTMIQRVQELALGYPEGRIELQLVGGYTDTHSYSEDLFFTIMSRRLLHTDALAKAGVEAKFIGPEPVLGITNSRRLLHTDALAKAGVEAKFIGPEPVLGITNSAFHKHPVEIDLTLACLGELNTTIRGGIHWPIIYGIGVNVKTGEIFPATFPDKGPDQPLRMARHLTGVPQVIRQVLDIYDCSIGLLRIGPFNYEPLRGVDLWLEQTDDFILQQLSTCPEVQPPHFVVQIRAALKYIQDNQFPAITVFRDNRPHYYRRDEHSGLWTPVRY